VDDPEPRTETAGEVTDVAIGFEDGLLLTAVNTGPAEKGLMKSGVSTAVMPT
jgi:hypothetical protein